jgi:hypothetical protein
MRAASVSGRIVLIALFRVLGMANGDGKNPVLRRVEFSKAMVKAHSR